MNCDLRRLPIRERLLHLVSAAKSLNLSGELLGLLLLSASLLVAWSLAVPIFECPDEPDHWQYARFLHDNWRLPVYGPEFVEANSPPLYYLLAAPLATTSDVPSRMTQAGSVRQAAWSPALFQHSSADLGKYAPLRRVRLLSAFLSVLSVLFCYLAGTEATGARDTGLLAAALMAFLPQFAFRGMNISNDALVTLMSAAATYLIVRLIKRGFTWASATVAAVLIALAFLSKGTAVFLSIPFALALLLERLPWRTRLRRLGVLGITLAIALPWLLRNQLLYGDPLASHTMLAAVSGLVYPKPIWSRYFVTQFPLLLGGSFVGCFGWMNLALPRPLYCLFILLAAAAVAGYAWRRARAPLDGRLLAVLVTMPLLNLAVVVYINLTFTQPQGRYLFPALGAVAVLAAIGLEGLPGWSRARERLLSTALVLVNLYILARIIVPTYWSPFSV